jgi:adenosylcobinamide-GDP ribazoletransferase
MIVGGAGALVFILCNLILGTEASVLGSLIVMVLLTGAFHEDGLADFCDGMGGGYSKEQTLSIMKDSQIGTYGAIALVLLFIAKVVLISEMDVGFIPVTIISAHALSRLNPVLMIFTSTYVQDAKKSKSKPIGKKSSFGVLVFAVLFALSPLVLLYLVGIPLLILGPILLMVQLLILVGFRSYVIRKIGGYSGDVLGALQQISEIAYYVTFLGVMASI